MVPSAASETLRPLLPKSRDRMGTPFLDFRRIFRHTRGCAVPTFYKVTGELPRTNTRKVSMRQETAMSMECAPTPFRLVMWRLQPSLNPDSYESNLSSFPDDTLLGSCPQLALGRRISTPPMTRD